MGGNSYWLPNGYFMKLGTALNGRLLILIPMAFCIFVLLDNQDKTVRLLALLVLIVLAQFREWMLLSGIGDAKRVKLAKDNKH